MEPQIWLRSVQALIFLTILCGFAFQNWSIGVLRRADAIEREKDRQLLNKRLAHVEETTIDCKLQVLTMVQDNARKLAGVRELITHQEDGA